MFVKSGIKITDSILVITLGCSKNIVDSERLMKQLSANSIKIEFNKENSEARTVIINTCGFINDAKKESIDTIIKYIHDKRNHKIDNLYVIGCLSERYASILRYELPEVDRFFGVKNIKEVVESLGFHFKNELIGERFLSTPSHYAYLKISEGCNRKCSFCAIPIIRGKYKSFLIDDLIEETCKLVENGVKEIILIAQDISYYGKDLYNNYQLSYLVKKICDIQGIEWVRLHYAYPLGFPLDILNLMNENSKMCKYIDLPIQHISDRILKKMRRGLNKQKTIKLIENIRKIVPGIAIRTTLLTGHPGETEKDFYELEEFVKDARFERLGIFTYSNEENTYSAKHFKNSIPEKIKLQRANNIMAIQQKISLEINQNRIDKNYKIIIDRFENEYIGRTEFDSPEVDNEVYLKSKKPLKIGNFYQVKIIGASEFDLIAVTN